MAPFKLRKTLVAILGRRHVYFNKNAAENTFIVKAIAFIYALLIQVLINGIKGKTENKENRRVPRLKLVGYCDIL